MKIGIEWENKVLWCYPRHWHHLPGIARALTRMGRSYRWRFKLG